MKFCSLFLNKIWSASLATLDWTKRKSSGLSKDDQLLSSEILNLNKKVIVLGEILIWECVHVHPLLVLQTKKQKLIQTEKKKRRQVDRNNYKREAGGLMDFQYQIPFLPGGPVVVSIWYPFIRLEFSWIHQCINFYSFMTVVHSKWLAHMLCSFLNVFYLPVLPI